MPVKSEHAVLERLQRLKAFFEREFVAFLVGPEGVGDHTVGAEHDHEALAARERIGKAQAGQVEHEWDGGGADAEVAKEFAARGGS